MATHRELPAWVLPVALLMGVLVIGLVIWRSVTGFNAPAEKDIAVRPGMYDMRAEMQKSRVPKP